MELKDLSFKITSMINKRKELKELSDELLEFCRNKKYALQLRWDTWERFVEKECKYDLIDHFRAAFNINLHHYSIGTYVEYIDLLELVKGESPLLEDKFKEELIKLNLKNIIIDY